MTPRPRVRIDELRSLLERADVTIADVARRFGVRHQFVHLVIRNKKPAPIWFERDVPGYLAQRIDGADAGEIRERIFDYGKEVADATGS